jgi:hypothetical protein
MSKFSAGFKMRDVTTDISKLFGFEEFRAKVLDAFLYETIHMKGPEVFVVGGIDGRLQLAYQGTSKDFQIQNSEHRFDRYKAPLLLIKTDDYKTTGKLNYEAMNSLLPDEYKLSKDPDKTQVGSMKD